MNDFPVVLYNYVSPPWEMSLYKGIPIHMMDYYLPIIRSMHNCKLRVKYRGPRKHRNCSAVNRAATCLKADAVSFAVYKAR